MNDLTQDPKQDVVDPSNEASQECATPEIRLQGVGIYKDAIAKYRNEIYLLVKDKTMSEQTAVRIILDQEYGFFNQLVSVHYNTEGQE